jgi:hypothetical protein
MEANFDFMEQTLGQTLEQTLGLTTREVDGLLNSSVLDSGMNQGRRTTTARQ